jgi:hypothetical protein
MALSPDRRFRLVNDYASARGFVSGFPNFHEADHGQGVVGGVFLLPSSTAEWRDVPRATYGVFHIEDVPALFRSANDYAGTIGFPAAYPNCHQQDWGAGVVYGTILLKDGSVEWRDVPRSDLGSPSIGDVGAMMRAANDYAGANGFAAGFPTFHQADHGAGVVYGINCIRQGYAEWRDVRIDDLFWQEPVEQRTLVALCRFRDDNGALTPTVADPDFYERYFFGAGIGSLHDYYRDVTHGKVSIAGEVHGWVDIGHTVAEHNAMQWQAQRLQAFGWGLQAARDAGVDVDAFPRQVVVINAETDWGGIAVGRSMLLPHTAATTWSHARGAHEFGHVLGLLDAFATETDAAGVRTDTGYGDDHCIMSYATRGPRFTTTFDGITTDAGPGLNGPHANRLGGIPPSRLVSVPPAGFAQSIMLAPLGHPEEEGALLVQVPPTLARTNTYWVELHDRSGWDRAIPMQSRVSVRETRVGDDHTFVLGLDDAATLDDPSDPAIVTPDGSIGIRFAARAGKNVTVRVWDLGPGRAQEVRVASIVANPPGDEVAGERVVIRNDRLVTVDLGGWRLRDDRSHPNSRPWTYVFPSFDLDPGEDVTLWTGRGADDEHNLHWGRTQAVWNNVGGDAAVLTDAAGTEVSRLAY